MFLTNSFGVAWNAEPIYVEVITRFNSFQAGIALRSFMGRKIRNKLDESLSQQKWTELVELVAPKLTGRQDRALLDSIQAFKGTPAPLAPDTHIKLQAEQWLKSAARRSA